MSLKEIIAQGFGIIGFILFALSFQCKKNKNLFIYQGCSGIMFLLNYTLIGAVSAALFNLTNIIRATVLNKKKVGPWQLAILCLLYTVCFGISLPGIWGNMLQIFLSFFTYASLIIMSVLMWIGNPKHIRYGQLFASSPAWLIHNIINFTLGGIICEIFAIISSIISLIRFRKGFED